MPADVRERITERTKAIMPVHLFGRPAALGELAALGLPVVEDAAQAFGAPGIATTGVVSTFSFYPTKNLGGMATAGSSQSPTKRSASAFASSVSTARATRWTSS
jgi:dTDP-4-amino-4,6-dideoxygalactose transaminase